MEATEVGDQKGIEDDIEGIEFYDEENSRIQDEDPRFHTWKTWARKIFRKLEKKASMLPRGNTAIAYYSTNTVKKVVHPMEYLPFWTGIMRPYFECGEIIATSIPVESEFSYLKAPTLPPRMHPLSVTSSG